MKTLKTFSDFILYSNIFISLCASAAAYQTYLVSGETNWTYVAFVFCSTFVFYNGQRIFLSKNYNTENSSERHKWILKNKKLLIVLCAVALLASIPLIINWSLKLIFIFGAFSIIASFYFLPKINLRAIPGVKAIYISLLWVFSTVVFPIMLVKQHETITSIFSSFYLFIILQRFFFILPLCIAFNIRDISVDKKTGVKTFPVIFGETKTKIICFILLFLFCGFVPYPGSPTGVTLIVSAIATAVLILFASEKRREYYYSFLLDGAILLQAGLVLIFSR